MNLRLNGTRSYKLAARPGASWRCHAKGSAPTCQAAASAVNPDLRHVMNMWGRRGRWLGGGGEVKALIPPGRPASLS